MPLQRYRAKRKFDTTPEPSSFAKALESERGKVKKKRGSNTIFVVQKHRARALHYDFRLEIEGVLRSWAVPKGIPLKPGVKHLAVETEDHPIEYGNFEGVIPEGNYGAGQVEIWDRGRYDMIEKKPRSLKFELFGKRLKGVYVLFDFNKKSWFLFKVKNS